jgi:hypothetical protein
MELIFPAEKRPKCSKGTVRIAGSLQLRDKTSWGADHMNIHLLTHAHHVVYNRYKLESGGPGAYVYDMSIN